MLKKIVLSCVMSIMMFSITSLGAIKYNEYEKLRKCLIAALSDSADEAYIVSAIADGQINDSDFYAGELEGLPSGYEQCIALVAYEEPLHVWKLYLFAVDGSYDAAILLYVYELEDQYNGAKGWPLVFENNQITVSSQMPFSAYSVHITLQWDGQSLIKTNVGETDPTQAYLDEQRALLEAEDINGLMELDAEGRAIFYPYNYEDYLTLPKPILILAHKQALAEYQNGNTVRAADILNYAINNYNLVHMQTDLEYGYSESNFAGEEEYLLSMEQFMGIVNDYAFFLFEGGEYQQSLALFLNVKELCPERVVVYINLGDLYWEIGDRENAALHYKKYKELLDDDTQIPGRVLDRI